MFHVYCSQIMNSDRIYTLLQIGLLLGTRPGLVLQVINLLLAPTTLTLALVLHFPRLLKAPLT